MYLKCLSLKLHCNRNIIDYFAKFLLTIDKRERLYNELRKPLISRVVALFAAKIPLLLLQVSTALLVLYFYSSQESQSTLQKVLIKPHNNPLRLVGTVSILQIGTMQHRKANDRVQPGDKCLYLPLMSSGIEGLQDCSAPWKIKSLK